jgi:hypothetical protein
LVEQPSNATLPCPESRQIGRKRRIVSSHGRRADGCQRCAGKPAPACRRSKFAVPHSACCLLFASDFSDVFCSALVFVAMHYERAKTACPKLCTSLLVTNLK